MSTFKNAGHSNNLEVLNQVTSSSSIFLGGQTSENPPADATPQKLPVAHVVVIPAGQDEITPARGSSSKRVKLIKHEKKWNVSFLNCFFWWSKISMCFLVLSNWLCDNYCSMLDLLSVIFGIISYAFQVFILVIQCMPIDTRHLCADILTF